MNDYQVEVIDDNVRKLREIISKLEASTIVTSGYSVSIVAEELRSQLAAIADDLDLLTGE